MPKRAYRTGLALRVAVLVSALAVPSARAQDSSTFTPPPPPPPATPPLPPDAPLVTQWQRGDPVPAGYHVVRSSVGGTLVGIGTGVFVVAYVPSFVYGLAGGWGCTIYRGACTSKPALLMIPAVGPLLYAPTDREPANTNSDDKLHIINAAMQTGGLALLIVGLVVDARTSSSLVPDSVDAAKTRVRVQPAVGGGFAGILVGASF